RKYLHFREGCDKFDPINGLCATTSYTLVLSAENKPALLSLPKLSVHPGRVLRSLEHHLHETSPRPVSCQA
ncbi:unnamed protein product, partial [Urochloa humidicola]